jgi:ell wall binding domain 2 (CWB2)
MFTFSVRHRDLAWGVALIVLLSAIWVARGDRADAAFGPPGTGIAVVYVAVSTNYPDSLGVGPGAGGNAAPIIIVPTNPPIPAATSAELIRLDPKTVIIVGGTAVISAAMETALEALLSNAAVTRIGGANRYETNAMFSAATFPIEGWASIPAAAFHGDSPDSDAVIASLYGYNTTDGVLYAPIQLPHGAEILELKADAHDTDNGQGIDVYLYQVSHLGSLQNPALASSTEAFIGGYTTVSDTTITAGTELVDNENYTYLVVVAGADGNPRIYNVRVRYRLGVSTG